MRITFCGHSKLFYDVEDIDRLCGILEEKISGQDVEFLIGTYGNFDNIAARCARIYKRKHKNCKICAVTPYIDLSTQKNKLKKIENTYDEIVYPALEKVPYKFSILKCNEWMVDNSDLVIAHVDADWGGAFKTLDYARRKKKEFINLGKFQF